ncbi:M14 family zinc carboxypeptidase [Gracilimonas mengyeensis]|uniref:Zinc carboxypeptidase n=1 Tax=Gracilimonas mengyeensis TaxID=1302730 RepID=A0A521EBI4_9BACT|nr:M14 family metallopeptidase [Gracilimonas mengyeensis]SMO80821.1 Zinc carboxypeptidase [Gracilimonas mengyeensis]
MNFSKTIKKAYWVLAAALFVLASSSQAVAQNDYYFPEGSEFDESIPTPEEFLGYEIGTHYTRHDRIVDYFEELARISDKASLQVIGQTVQKRPQVVLTITDPANHQNLEEIRENHLTLIDPDADLLDIEEAKSVVALNYSVHGDESSSGEAALLTAYYFVANQSAETQNLLEESIIHIDPAQNPDGRDRAAHWHNSYKSFPPVSDPNDIEHNQGWPRGRTNHFLHDLNRDWFAVTQQESANRVAFYQKWYPNIQIDFHEMGTNSTYYLEPTQPERTWNPIVPEYHYEVLNPLLAEYHTDALNELGALYWTKEVFDNISPIYGSTYPDILGGVGVTFEVGSSRGLVQESVAGDVTFENTIRRHLRTGIATVRAGVGEKKTLLEYQKDFYETALEEAEDQPVRAYVFGDEADKTLTNKFLDLLLKHKLEVYKLEEERTVDGKTFSPEAGYILPTSQANYRLIHDIFETYTEYADSVFYDITAWSLVQGYGIKYGEITSGGYNRDWGTPVESVPEQEGKVVGGQADYAYLLSWSDYNASAALYHLLDEGVRARVAHQPFTSPTSGGDVDFGYGSVIISVAEQDNHSPDELYEVIEATAEEFSLTFHTTSTGYNTGGIDLGSGNAQVVDKPEAAVVFGYGVSAYDAGEAWFLLNKHLGIDITKINSVDFGDVNLSRYNTLLLVDGDYEYFDQEIIDKIKTWVNDGGTLITSAGASVWAVRNEIVSENFLDSGEDTSAAEEDETVRYNYEERRDRWLAGRIPGVILEADIDPSHPIAFGTEDRSQLFLKENGHFLYPSSDPYGTVAYYGDDPHRGGFLNEANKEKVKNKASILVSGEGSGNVILFSENPTFRSYWHTSSRLLLNALLFGNNL